MRPNGCGLRGAQQAGCIVAASRASGAAATRKYSPFLGLMQNCPGVSALAGWQYEGRSATIT